MGNGVSIPVHSSKIHDHIKKLKGFEELRDSIHFKVVEFLIFNKNFFVDIYANENEIESKIYRSDSK